AVLDDNIVVGRSTDGVQTDFERVNKAVVHQPVTKFGRRLAALVVDDRVGVVGPRVLLLGEHGLPAARVEQHIPGLAKLLAARELEMNAVQTRVGHDGHSGQGKKLSNSYNTIPFPPSSTGKGGIGADSFASCSFASCMRIP